MKVSAHVRVSGPLVSHVAGFAAELTQQGYTDLSLANQLRLVADFSRWLDDGGIGLEDLTTELVEQFRAKRRRTHTARWSVAPLLQYLRAAGAVPPSAPTEPHGDQLLRRYATYLVDERALSASVRASYQAVASKFLDGQQPAQLSGAAVMAFVRRLENQPGFVGRLSALRSVLRFLHVAGETPISLVYAVPSAAHWRQSSLPQALDPAQVRAVLASCDRRTTMGRRDYAVVLLMLRLGLRACEVAGLSLDDIDWTNGEIVVHGKGTTVSRLPLPIDVGEVLVAHLRRRRRSAPMRALFLRSRAPCRAATTSAIVAIAGRALRRAGIATGGGHRLRHTAATRMLRRGASLTEIAQVLRHRHVDTTAIYAKVDRDALRSLARPWPTTTTVDRVSLRTLAQPWPGGAA
jgi:integrase/recombinase XerD